MASIAQSLTAAAARLAPCSTSARLDAEVLLAHCLERGRGYLLAWPDKFLTEDEHLRYQQLVARRAAGEPVAHITGAREFWSLPLRVNAHTLVPRPETERLVELALARLPADRALRIADIGTGSGAIALALAAERPRCHVIATDISLDALAVARDNAARLELRHVEFRHGDACAPLAEERFDMIVSNPPYLRADDPHLREGDLPFEPRAALAAGPGGLEMLERIAREARARLVPGGWLLMEHGYDQGGAAVALLRGLEYIDARDHQDLSGVDRVIAGRRPPDGGASAP